MIRDDEISRLIKYAEGLGLKVVFSYANEKHASAEWTLDGSEITIFKKNNWSKTETILSLIHELGHHLWFIHSKDRNPDLKFEEAIDKQNLTEELINKKTPKKLRKKILDVEIAGSDYWEIVVKDVNIKLPMWKIKVAKIFDIWQYEYFYENGTFPKYTVKKNKYKELIAQYKE
jgi:hypothetical protein